MTFADHIDNGLDRYAGTLEVDQQLAQAVVAGAGVAAGAYQRDHHVRLLGDGGPYLLAVEAPAALDLDRTATHRRQIRSRTGLGESDAEVHFAARYGRQEALALRLGAEAQQQRAALPVRD